MCHQRILIGRNSLHPTDGYQLGGANSPLIINLQLEEYISFADFLVSYHIKYLRFHVFRVPKMILFQLLEKITQSAKISDFLHTWRFFTQNFCCQEGMVVRPCELLHPSLIDLLLHQWTWCPKFLFKIFALSSGIVGASHVYTYNVTKGGVAEITKNLAKMVLQLIRIVHDLFISNILDKNHWWLIPDGWLQIA